MHECNDAMSFRTAGRPLSGGVGVKGLGSCASALSTLVHDDAVAEGPSEMCGLVAWRDVLPTSHPLGRPIWSRTLAKIRP